MKEIFSEKGSSRYVKALIFNVKYSKSLSKKRRCSEYYKVHWRQY